MDNKYGALLQPDIKHYRKYFEEFLRLLGIQILYYQIKPSSKDYSTYGELLANYETPLVIGCIFEEHPNQNTMRKLGWDVMLDKEASLIHVAYDTPGLQQGNLVAIPSGIDHAQGRLFRIVGMTNSIIYPSSIACKIVPEYQSTLNREDINNFTNTDFNLLKGDDDLV